MGDGDLDFDSLPNVSLNSSNGSSSSRLEREFEQGPMISRSSKDRSYREAGMQGCIVTATISDPTP